jgi:hypothetical protein
MSEYLLLMPGLESATLCVAGQVDVPLSECVLTEPKTWRELDPSGGYVVRRGQTFIWPSPRSPEPPLGAVVIDEAGVYWTVLSAIYKHPVEVWEASCVNLAVYYGLDNFATILRADSYTKNAAGEAVPVWTAISPNVPARWQPLSESAEIWEDADFTKTTYRVTFGAMPLNEPKQLAGGNFRLVDKAGNRFRVTEYIDEQRIDRLPIALCVRILEGAEYQGGTP